MQGNLIHKLSKRQNRQRAKDIAHKCIDFFGRQGNDSNTRIGIAMQDSNDVYFCKEWVATQGEGRAKQCNQKCQ